MFTGSDPTETSKYSTEVIGDMKAISALSPATDSASPEQKPTSNSPTTQSFTLGGQLSVTARTETAGSLSSG